LRKAGRRQLSFAFADSPQGDSHAATSGGPEGKAWLLLRAKGKEARDPAARAGDTSRLLEQVASAPNLARALLKVARNRGAAGVDGRSVAEVVEASRRVLPKLRHELLLGRYRPGDVRRVWIPKPGGGQRGLGIPNVVDRWVQESVRQVLEPIFEPTFHDSSHGFRPERGAHTAIAKAKEYVEQGHGIVVDFDLSKFFDRVNHQRLLNRLGQRVADGRVLKLVHQMLKAKVVMPDGTRVSTEQGTPQGGPLSPLLSNVVLDELDWELERRGLRFVRYADDANVFVRSERAGQRVLASLRRFIERRLRLRLNEEKTTVDRPGKLHFLGFRLTRNQEGQVEVHLSARTVQRLKCRIRELTPRTWGGSLKACLKQANQYLRGWLAHFRICTEKGARSFRPFDAHLRRRLRMIISRQKGRRPRYLYRHLRARGVSHGAAWPAAYCRRGPWNRSNRPGMTRAYPNAWFSERLISLWTEWHRLNPPARALGQQLELFG
jgi:group II intron reverse transcriptase/maturase